MRTRIKPFFWRGIFDMLLIIAALFLPWWFTVLFACALFFMFDAFIEILIVALLMDVLYGIQLSRFGNVQFVLSLGTFVVFILLTFLKKRMRF